MSAAPPSSVPPESGFPLEQPRRRSRRPWRDKFRVAVRGIKLGVRGESSFAVHFFLAVLVLVAAGVLDCRLWQWCVLLGCIGLVLIAELFNSAIETLFRGLDEVTRERAWPSLDIAAGAVLLASICASLIGTLVLGYQLLVLLHFLPASQ
jgi:diacylglycerol kinase